MFDRLDKTIISMISAKGVSAVSLFRISGDQAISITDKIIKLSNKKKKLKDIKGYTISKGSLYDNLLLIDHVLVFLFRKPKSYTGEDVVEISTHGSIYIQNKILQIFINNGADLALGGEFTFRAFLNKKIDLCQAESVLDVINSCSLNQHKLALNNLSGFLSKKIFNIKNKVINFASLIELELDFSEENINLFNYNDLVIFLKKIKNEIEILIKSFSIGQIVKEGVKVVIAGPTNSGKSTLFNLLINKERSIVSDISGTTRDFIEEQVNIDELKFIFIDTAGIRNASDIVEIEGIKRTFNQIEDCAIIVYVFDLSKGNIDSIIQDFNVIKSNYPNKNYIFVGNKCDLIKEDLSKKILLKYKNIIFISAKFVLGLDIIKKSLTHIVKNNIKKIYISNNDLIITNNRHYECFCRCLHYIDKIIKNLNNNIPGDLLFIDLKEILLYLGEITGHDITNDDILTNIFSKFCIGK